ncbi:hypothetical protein [Burkholderia territorii]|uniref:hypothetical protein n=2 Tax=Burkholderia territorii TaxID=1503055 RepID=UPI0009C0EB69|nr:hypothetical protein [Burkholderia territorii]
MSPRDGIFGCSEFCLANGELNRGASKGNALSISHAMANRVFHGDIAFEFRDNEMSWTNEMDGMPSSNRAGNERCSDFKKDGLNTEYKMKIGKCIIAAAGCIAFTGIVHAGPTSPQAVVKTIRLTARIDDSLFVSKPDTAAGYGVVELKPTGGARRAFGATLPVRIYTTNPDIHVALLQPLTLSNGRCDMTDTKVMLANDTGHTEIVGDGARTLTVAKPGINGTTKRAA